MDLNDAIAELISVHVGPGMGIPFEPLDFANETTGRAFATVIATILNAAASGQLIPLETCNARVAAMVEAAARVAAAWRLTLDGGYELLAAIRALATADAQAALDAMISRAREVKPLVWGPWEHGNAIAESILGTYCVWDGYWRPPRQQGGIPDADPYAAAQADYTARIHAVLRANAMDASEGER